MGFLVFCVASSRPKKWQPSREIAESLQPSCVIFPFSGDSARRPFRSALRDSAAVAFVPLLAQPKAVFSGDFVEASR